MLSFPQFTTTPTELQYNDSGTQHKELQDTDLHFTDEEHLGKPRSQERRQKQEHEEKFESFGTCRKPETQSKS